MPLRINLQETVDVRAGSFEIGEALAHPLIKNLSVDVQRQALRNTLFQFIC